MSRCSSKGFFKGDCIVFDCILHNVLIAKVHAFGLSQTVSFIYSCLNHRKQKEKVNNF